MCVHVPLSQSIHPHNLQCPEITVKYEHQRENASISPGSNTENTEIQRDTHVYPQTANSWLHSERYLDFEQARSVGGRRAICFISRGQRASSLHLYFTMFSVAQLELSPQFLCCEAATPFEKVLVQTPFETKFLANAAVVMSCALHRAVADNSLQYSKKIAPSNCLRTP